MRYFAAIVMALLSVACSTSRTTGGSEDESIKKSWQLMSINGEDVNVSPKVYIALSDSGMVSGYVGCNTLMANYAVQEDMKITFSKLSTTRMACSDEAMNLEKSVLDMLSSVDSYQMVDDHWVLSSDGKQVAIFSEKDEDHDLVGVNWKLTMLGGEEVTLVENQEKAQYFRLQDNGTFVGFAGCNDFNGSYTLGDDNKIHFGDDIIMTLKSCPDLDIVEDNFIQVFRSAASYALEDDHLTLMDAEGMPLAEFEEMEKD